MIERSPFYSSFDCFGRAAVTSMNSKSAAPVEHLEEEEPLPRMSKPALLSSTYSCCATSRATHALTCVAGVIFHPGTRCSVARAWDISAIGVHGLAGDSGDGLGRAERTPVQSTVSYYYHYFFLRGTTTTTNQSAVLGFRADETTRGCI